MFFMLRSTSLIIFRRLSTTSPFEKASRSFTYASSILCTYS